MTQFGLSPEAGRGVVSWVGVIVIWRGVLGVIGKRLTASNGQWDDVVAFLIFINQMDLFVGDKMISGHRLLIRGNAFRGTDTSQFGAGTRDQMFLINSTHYRSP